MPDPDGPLPAFPYGGVMFVAHNLDDEGRFCAGRRRVEFTAAPTVHGGADSPMLTWKSLYRLLDNAEVSASECFFTNAYVGLKAGDDPTGRFPGARDGEFRA